MGQDTDILIDDLRQQKPAACQRFLAEYGPAVFRTVRRIVPRQEDAEEVYQDVFVKALRGIATFQPQKASLAAWLNRIAYNESLNFVRGKKPALVYMDDCYQEPSLMDVPEDASLDEQVIQYLEQALATLPPHERAIISMFYYDDMSLADIAYVTGSTPSAVASHLCRIRKKLYRIIKPFEQWKR